VTPASRVLISRKNTEANKRHIRDLMHSGWQKPYLDAMLEINPDRLKDRVASAEAAIQLRLRELADSPDSQVERQCLADACNGLLVLKKEASPPPSNHGAWSRVSSPLPGMK